MWTHQVASIQGCQATNVEVTQQGCCLPRLVLHAQKRTGDSLQTGQAPEAAHQNGAGWLVLGFRGSSLVLPL